jgi:hypothetical protein
LIGSQWGLNNSGAAVAHPCPDCPVACIDCFFNTPDCGCCEPSFGVPGTADADIDAPEAWALHLGDPDVIVAVLDSGADMDHPDLLTGLVSGRNFVKGECVDSCNLPGSGSCPQAPCDQASNSHGTRIAGIISAWANNGQGIAGLTRGCRVMPLRIVSATFDITWIKNAIIYAAGQPQVRVLNMSWLVTEVGSLDRELQTAFDVHKLMVAAAGNCFTNELNGCPPTAPCSLPVVYPASNVHVMAVTSTNHNGGRSCFAHIGPQMSVAAPGEAIVTTVNPEFSCDCNPQTNPDSYCRGNGTSFAAPHVAGLAALLFSVNTNFTDVQVRRIIQGTADDFATPGHDVEFGCGRINALRAVSRALGQPCGANVDGDCVVGILDFLDLLGSWGPCGADICCPADINFDGAVGITDLLALLSGWGSCAPGCPPPPPLAQEIAAAGLTQAEWDTLQDCVVTGTPEPSANCVCWMEHYMDCHRNPTCAPLPHPVTCAGADPLGHH